MRRVPRVTLLLAAWMVLTQAAAHAQAPTPVTVPTAAGDVTVLADRLEQVEADNLMIATGNVEVSRGTVRILGDRIEVNRETGDMTAQGRVVLYDGEDQLTGDRIDYNFKTGTGVVYHGEAHTAPYYRVSGERLERAGEGIYRVRRGFFTTCEADPPPWSFHMGSAVADLNEAVYGTNASVWIRNVPVIPWIPFFAAALRRERQTGFLFPTFGNSTRKGYFAELPFYWAISDSQDATITLEAFEKRGVGATGEYRYILSSTQQGAVTGFYLRETEVKDDRLRQNAGISQDRGWYGIKHNWLIDPGLTLKVDVNGVTDNSVLREYSDALHQRSLQRVESNVFLSRRWPTWNLVGNLFWYQDLTALRPIELQRLPDLRLDGTRQPLPGLPGFLYQVEASAVNFVRTIGSEGVRVDVHPRLSRPISAAGFFTVTPFVGGRLTGYDKTVTGTHVTREGSFTVEDTADVFRLRKLIELGTDFETRASRVYLLRGLGGVDAVLHSIEPRMNYTFIEGDHLAHVPNWSAIDTIPATSTLTYSITNRFRGRTLAPPGTEPYRWEFVRFVASQNYNFIAHKRPFGNLSGDLIVQPQKYFRFRADAGYNPYDASLQTANTDLSLTVPRLTASVGTRFNRKGGPPATTVDPSGFVRTKQSNVEFLQGTLRGEITRNLAARFTTNWDLATDTFVENRMGVDLRFQCYALSVDYVVRSRQPVANSTPTPTGVNRVRSATENEIRFALNLLGVGGPFQTAVGLGTLGGGSQAGPGTAR